MKHFTFQLPITNTEKFKNLLFQERSFKNWSSQILLLTLLMTWCCVRSSTANSNFFWPLADNSLNIFSDITDTPNDDCLFEIEQHSSSLSLVKNNHESDSWLKPNAAFFSNSASLMMPTISILDPCTCRESVLGSGGSATTTENGQFIETIQVTAPNGQNWYIVEAIGFYDVTSVLPPLSPTIMTTGLTGVSLTETPAGVYSLPGIHVDAVGYSITLTNGTDTLTSANTCFYPNPQITSGLRGGYCTGQAPIPLTGDGGVSNGMGQFDIIDELGNIVVADATDFEPTVLPVGTYEIRYTFDEEDNAALPCMNCSPGCVQAISQFVDLIDNSGAMACNDNLQISLDGDCVVEVMPDMVLEGDFDSYNIFDVALFQNFTNIGNVLTAAQIGINLQVKVTNSCSGNSCWGSLVAEDKLPPSIDCPIAPIAVSCTADIEDIAAPTATDNCEGNITPVLISESINTINCGNAAGILINVIRFWHAQDIYGNAAMNCQQTIQIQKPSFADVQMPPNLDDVDAPSLDCTDLNSDPDYTGYPTINGVPLNGNSYCDFTLSYNDLTIASCSGSYKIQRTWSVFDWCIPTQIGMNPLTFTQTIKYLDKTPPNITAPNDLTISAFGENCTGDVILPEALVTDDCSEFTVSISAPFQFLASNGGLVEGLLLGVHTIIYTATDDCGNSATDEMILTVVDDVVPSVICDQSTVVSIDNSGSAELFAVELDDGSYDNCSPILNFAIQIMDSGESFAPSVFFNCEDADSIIQVIVSITDLMGNVNFCMVNVEVQNKIGPTLFCPPAITIECTEDVTDLSITGLSNEMSNCGIANIGYNDISSNIDACGIGDIVREFFVVDGSGLVATCTQNITITNSNPVTLNDIEFPADYMISDCITSEVLHPDSLPLAPINYSYPIFEDVSCALLAVNYQDQVLTVAPPACFEILRTWTIIDWCIYDFDDPTGAGIFQETQLITVVDTLDPVITCPADQVYPILEDDCLTDITLPEATVDDCNPDTDITVISDFGFGLGPFLNIPEGIYDVTYTANDGCNNTAICAIQITVIDGKKPAPKCQNLNTVIMPNNGMIGVDIGLFESGSDDNCTSFGDLLFSFSANSDSTIAIFDCSMAGENTIQLWVTDLVGNQDFCEATLDIQDPNDVCMGGLVVLSGEIMNDENELVNMVEMQLSGDENAAFSTNTNGVFVFENIQIGGDYTITPDKDIALLNGVTTIDLALITKHVLGMQLIDTPYKMIAADINNNGLISTSDVVALRKAILFIENEFPNNTSWRFIAADFEFTDPANPFLDDLPAFINYNNISNSDLSADFIAIKIGDINGNANPQNLLVVDDRTGEEPFQLRTENKYLEEGEIFEMAIFVNDLKNLACLQFGLGFDQLTLVEIVETDFTKSINFGISRLEEELLTFSWTAIDQSDWNIDEAFIIIKWEAKANLELKEHLNIHSETIISEIGQDFGNEITDSGNDIELVFEAIEEVVTIKNYPNPFRNKTSIQVNLFEATDMSLKIFSAEGKLIWEKIVDGKIGKNMIFISEAEIEEKGVLVFQLETNRRVFHHKMIRLE